MNAGQNDQREGGVEGGGGNDVVGGEAVPQARQGERGRHRANPQRAVQNAVAQRALMQVVARNHRQQRPDRREEEAEGEDPQQRGLKIGRVAHIAQARADGGRNPLRGQRRFEERDALPVEQHPDDRGERDRVQQKDVGAAGVGALKGGDHQAAQRGADGAGEIVGGGVQRDAVGHQLARHEFGHNRLPCWIVHRRTDVQQEGERQQRPRRDVAEEGENSEDADRAQHPALPEDQQAAAVEEVRGGPGQQPQTEHRQAGRRLHQRDQQRRRSQRGHQPGARGVLHPGADARDRGGDPAIAKDRNAQRSKAAQRLVGGSIVRRIWCLEGHCIQCLVY